MFFKVIDICAQTLTHLALAHEQLAHTFAHTDFFLANPSWKKLNYAMGSDEDASLRTAILRMLSWGPLTWGRKFWNFILRMLIIRGPLTCERIFENRFFEDDYLRINLKTTDLRTTYLCERKEKIAKLYYIGRPQISDPQNVHPQASGS